MGLKMTKPFALLKMMKCGAIKVMMPYKERTLKKPKLRKSKTLSVIKVSTVYSIESMTIESLKKTMITIILLEVTTK